MKIAPVSADLLIKVALIAAGAGLLWWGYRKTLGVASSAVESVQETLGEVADAVIVGTNPVNPENWINRAVTAAGTAVAGGSGPGANADGSWTVGGWLYDVTHPGWMSAAMGTASGATPVFNPSEPILTAEAASVAWTGGASGSW